MKYLVITLVFLLSTPLFAAEECLSFFKGSVHENDGVKPPATYPCLEYKKSGLPSDMFGTKYSLHHFAQNWSGTDQDLKILGAVSQAIKDSANALSQLVGLTPKKIKVLYTNDFANDNRWGDAGMTGDTCHIRLFYHIGGGVEETIKSVVAHEIHHCYLLDNMFPDNQPRYHFQNWLVEGSADFFMDYVYPTYNTEWDSAINYDMDLPLTGQTNPYSTTIFFQHWSNNGGSFSQDPRQSRGLGIREPL